MCLYSLLQTPCHHGECQIAISIYRNSESYIQNGFNFPNPQKSNPSPILQELQQQKPIKMPDENPNPQSPEGIRPTNKIGSSRSLVESDKQDKIQMFKILKKIRKDMRELKNNQTVIISKIESLQREWYQFRDSSRGK